MARSVMLDSPALPTRMLSARRWALVAATIVTGLLVPSQSRAATPAPLDRDLFLRAIGEVETGGNPRAVGSRGERGIFQFSRRTWQQYTTRSFSEAHVPSVAIGVAERHFDWLHEGIVRNGREPTPYLLAAAWNAGLTRALSGNLPRATRDYALRVSNIVASLQPRPRVTPALAPAAVPAADPLPRLFAVTAE